MTGPFGSSGCPRVRTVPLRSVSTFPRPRTVRKKMFLLAFMTTTAVAEVTCIVPRKMLYDSVRDEAPAVRKVADAFLKLFIKSHQDQSIVLEHNKEFYIDCGVLKDALLATSAEAQKLGWNKGDHRAAFVIMKKCFERAMMSMPLFTGDAQPVPLTESKLGFFDINPWILTWKTGFVVLLLIQVAVVATYLMSKRGCFKKAQEEEDQQSLNHAERIV